MIIAGYIVIILFILYRMIIGNYSLSWKLIIDHIPRKQQPKTSLTVIIPARNEEKNLPALLNAIRDQTYPKELFEVIVVNDCSTDGTTEIVRQYPEFKLIELKNDNINSYKKKAIETGIEASKGDWIITTDADCIPGSKWLATIMSHAEEYNSVFIAAPVDLINDSSFLQVFQELDFLVLQGITGAAVFWKQHSMCNGANLAYQKKAFYEVGGFSGIDKIASGDDMLLMSKIRKRYPDRVHYVRSVDAIVRTQPMKTWKEFFNQRIRWASKAKYYNERSIKFIMAIVYLVNLSFPMMAIMGFYNYRFMIFLAIMFAVKIAIEFPLVNNTARFFNKRKLVKYFFFFQPIHILYTIISGLFGQFGTYEWKGRRVK